MLISQFKVAAEDVDGLLEGWADDAAFMEQQPGLISTQRRRGAARKHDPS